MNFCRRCGAELTNSKDHVFTCQKGHVIFANASPAAGVFLLNDAGEVLLAVRGTEPNKGMLDVFGGFLDGEERAEDALVRELKEELELDVAEYSEPQFLITGTQQYNYKGETLPLLTLLFWAKLHTNRPLTPLDDVAEIYTAPLDKVDVSRLQSEDIALALKKLQKIHKLL